MTRRQTAFLAAIILGLILTFALSISNPTPVQAQTLTWSAVYSNGDIFVGGNTPTGDVATYTQGTNQLALNFDNRPLAGDLVTPLPNTPEDNWSVILTASVPLQQGEYQMSLQADDKADFRIGGGDVPILTVTQPGQVATTGFLAGGGNFTFTVRWADLTGNANLTLTWQLVGGGGGGVQPLPTATPAPTATATNTPLPPIPPGALTGTVIRAAVLNIRDAPSLGGNRIGRILRGQTYAVIGRDEDARWFLLQLGGYQGWAYGYYLFFNFNEFTAPITSGNAVLGLAGQPDTGVRVQSRATLRLRAQPTVASMQTGRVTWGAFLPVVGRTADGFWYQIVWRGTVGWVYSPFLDILAGDLNNVPVTFP